MLFFFVKIYGERAVFLLNEKNKKKNKNFVFDFMCLGVIALVLYSVCLTFLDVHDKRNEKKNLDLKLYELKEENERLKVEVNRLKDAQYVARYVREKFLYSGKNEYVFRLK